MTFFQAVFLGFIQGVTEFFPISSSAHLIVLPRLLGWEPQPLFFDTSVHLATGLVILWFFRRRWWGFLQERDYQTLVGIGLAAAPAGVVGFLAQNLVEERLRALPLLIFQLVWVSFLMLWAQRWSRRQLRAGQPWSLPTLLRVGLAQILALAPGTSRSGITLSVGLASGLSPRQAAEVSFLVGLPVILGAGVYEGAKNASDIFAHGSLFGVGFLAALISGWLTLRWLLRILNQYSLTPFAFYRLALAAVLLLVWL